MNYKQAESYLYNFVNFENIPGIDYTAHLYNLNHIIELLHRIGNPHLNRATIHIAGSKGKGSIASMISRVLTCAGYKTGLYTSPHLHTLRERIQINGEPISERHFTHTVEELKPSIDAMQLNPSFRNFTFFEILTVLAFAYFSKLLAEIQVLEVGLGGRLDATNVVSPDICIITPVGLEHTQILGDTVPKIAYEKAGIIKKGSVVISSPQLPQGMKVLRDVSKHHQARFIETDKVATWHKISHDLNHQEILVRTELAEYPLVIPLLGDYQLENAATALVAIENLISKGFNISRDSINNGFKSVMWPGRFQILHKRPIVLVDGAHSVESIQRLVQSIKHYLKYRKLYLVVGLSGDKDMAGIVKQLVSLSPRVVATRSDHPRALAPSLIADEFNHHDISTIVTESTQDAVKKAMKEADKEDLICITGSLFVVSEVIEYFSSTFNFIPAKDSED
jgi:dihydrofolate synthase/folylpolyglutamate synthase